MNTEVPRQLCTQDFFKKFSAEGISAYIIPSWDEWQNEYVSHSHNRLFKVTNFSGSNGIAIIMKNGKHGFFTDGRYTLQARKQLADNYEILDLSWSNIIEFLQSNLAENEIIGYDGRVITYAQYNKLHKALSSQFQLQDTGDIIGLNANESEESIAPNHNPRIAANGIEILPTQVVGRSVDDKVSDLRSRLKMQSGDAYLVTNPDSICWLLNIRGFDIPNLLVLLAYALVRESEVILYWKSEISEGDNLLADLAELGIKLKSIKDLEHDIKTLSSILYLSQNSGIFFHSLNKAVKIRLCEDHIMLMKLYKTEEEIEGFKYAHIEDGLALTRFLYWLETNYEKYDEYQISEKLLEFRKLSPNFIMPSFSTIAGYGSNGAIIHYRAEKQTAKKLGSEELFLLDSGGHYHYGTTDVTRTIKFSHATDEEKKYFTLVLRGMVDLMMSQFEEGTSGMALDAIARKPLQHHGYDYAHGTGHGVGHYLNVHEGPFSLNKKGDMAIGAGMVMSIEPGFYLEDKFGIRIENLVYTDYDEDSDDDILRFHNLTLAPILPQLVDFSLLDRKHVLWLSAYHARIMSTFARDLSNNQLLWLRDILAGYDQEL